MKKRSKQIKFQTNIQKKWTCKDEALLMCVPYSMDMYVASLTYFFSNKKNSVHFFLPHVEMVEFSLLCVFGWWWWWFWRLIQPSFGRPIHPATQK